MDKDLQANTSLLLDQDRNTRTWVITYGISLLLHVVLFIVLVAATNIHPREEKRLSFIEVGIVSAPAPAPEKTSEEFNAQTNQPVKSPEKVKVEKVEKKPNVTPKEKKPVKTVQKPVTLHPKKKVSLKHQTYRAENAIQKAIKKIEKDVESNTEPSRPKSVTDAINRLKNEVNSEQANVKGAEKFGVIGTGSDRPLEPIDLYKLQIHEIIGKNWAFSEELAAGRKDLECWIVINITNQGEIKEIWFEKRSGNSNLDDSAYRAVKKSNPLPPLPKGYLRPVFTIGLQFTPKGLQ